MIVNCEWITCLHNSVNPIYKKNTGHCDSLGLCNVIVLQEK
ncbi:hypothetical protein [Clostridium estertheticum]|nr:hypothetical protein [Clostridium estertheticum]